MATLFFLALVSFCKILFSTLTFNTAPNDRVGFSWTRHGRLGFCRTLESVVMAKERVAKVREIAGGGPFYYWLELVCQVVHESPPPSWEIISDLLTPRWCVRTWGHQAGKSAFFVSGKCFVTSGSGNQHGWLSDTARLLPLRSLDLFLQLVNYAACPGAVLQHRMIRRARRRANVSVCCLIFLFPTSSDDCDLCIYLCVCLFLSTYSFFFFFNMTASWKWMNVTHLQVRRF